MKTYSISLARAVERRAYIKGHLENRGLDFVLIDAVDGSMLSPKEVEAYCDPERLEKLRWWLTNGAIGCALSHLECYNRIVASGDACAFIVEDDVILPANISVLLAEAAACLRPDEVILFYFSSFKPCRFSIVGAQEISSGTLVYPLDINLPITATAYLIGKTAAANMAQAVVPIEVTADSWAHYYNRGVIGSLRCLYPLQFQIRHFKSTIDYHDERSLKGRVLQFIDHYKVPGIYHWLRWRRMRFNRQMTTHFTLSDEVSPVYQKLQLE